jgi:hypothetical protein
MVTVTVAGVRDPAAGVVRVNVDPLGVPAAYKAFPVTTALATVGAPAPTIVLLSASFVVAEIVTAVAAPSMVSVPDAKVAGGVPLNASVREDGIPSNTIGI